MKKNKVMNKRIILALFLIIAIIIGSVLIYKNNKKTEKNKDENNNEINQTDVIGQIDMSNTENAKIENGVKRNVSENILKDRNLDGITITQIQLKAQDGLSHFTATVQNNSIKDFGGGIAKLNFIDKDGNVYAKLEVYIPETKSGETNTIDASTTSDIVNAYDFSIELEK